MATASFRFHGDLWELLRPDDRTRASVGLRFDVAPSVKDAIESLGVPHTEVGAIEVDGLPAGFERRLADGDRVDVHPVAAADTTGGGLQPERPAVVRFVVDGHLGTLARYLRLLGFDTLYDPGWDDARLADVAATEQRVLLTRDRGLLKRRVVAHGLLVRPDDPEEQLLDVARRLGLGPTTEPFGRCMACNGRIVDVRAATVEDRVPPATRQRIDRFRRCTSCGRVYWEGSHHRRLADLVRRVQER